MGARFFKHIPASLERQNLEPYSTITHLNSREATEFNREVATNQLALLRTLQLSFYNTREIWKLDDDKPYNDEEKKWAQIKKILIIVSCIVGVAIIIAICACCFCKKKKRKQRQIPYRQRSYNQQTIHIRSGPERTNARRLN